MRKIQGGLGQEARRFGEEQFEGFGGGGQGVSEREAGLARSGKKEER